jgi:hypothetical protein
LFDLKINIKFSEQSYEWEIHPIPLIGPDLPVSHQLPDRKMGPIPIENDPLPNHLMMMIVTSLPWLLKMESKLRDLNSLAAI